MRGGQPYRRAKDFAALSHRATDYRHLERRANEEGISDKERDRLCGELRAARDKIREYRPVTLRGVLMVLDLAGEIEDPHWWPEKAIESLRKMVEMGEVQP